MQAQAGRDPNGGPGGGGQVDAEGRRRRRDNADAARDDAIAVAQKPAAVASPRLRILVVSPSRELREATVATLKEAGHKVRVLCRRCCFEVRQGMPCAGGRGGKSGKNESSNWKKSKNEETEKAPIFFAHRKKLTKKLKIKNSLAPSPRQQRRSSSCLLGRKMLASTSS